MLEISNLHVRYEAKGGHGHHQVLAGADLRVDNGELVGVIGETGSGKTTLGRAVVGMAKVQSGSIKLDGEQISGLRGRALLKLRRSGRIAFIFQDPLRSLDPGLTVAQSIAEGLAIQGASREEREHEVSHALELVGLEQSLGDRTPGQISGGQRQRVAIARALALKPELLICDEPVSALDASNRGYILGLLARLREELGIAMLIISHDLVSLAEVVDRVAVLHGGKFVEQGAAESVFNDPQHPYTAELIASAPALQRARQAKAAARQLVAA